MVYSEYNNMFLFQKLPKTHTMHNTYMSSFYLSEHGNYLLKHIFVYDLTASSQKQTLKKRNFRSSYHHNCDS